MQDSVSRYQPDPYGLPIGPSIPFVQTPSAPAKCENATRKRRPKTKSHRIIFRLTDELYEALMARSRDIGCDLSHVVRSALDARLKSETATDEPQKPILRTAEIDMLVDDYRAEVSEDIRQVRKRLFGHLLAASYVAKMNFPRTPGVVDGYQSLLRLQHLFGYGENG
jgi:hypothetical protein